MDSSTITSVWAREVLDSAAILRWKWKWGWNPAMVGRAAVPSGASTGTREAP